jgi:signal transduction histidine kinase
MVTKLRQIPIQIETDLLVVHSEAMQLASLAGVKIAEQVSFAAMIISYCDTSSWPDSVIFNYETTGEIHYLTATFQNQSYIIRKVIPFPFTSHQLTALTTQLHNQAYQQQRLKDLEQFSFALSHELKTSLAKLQLSITLLEREVLNQQVNKFVEMIHRSASSLERTLIGLNKVMEHGHQSSKVVERVSLQDVFDQVYLEFAELFARAQATVTTDISSVTDFSYIEIYLRTIFTNLFSNAIKYADPSRPLQLYVTALREGDTVIMTVIDNAQGIDMEENGHMLFHPFTRFTDKTEGSGIGLYLVKSMAERNGGSVEVESSKGKGTTFRFYLKEYNITDKISQAAFNGYQKNIGNNGL